MTADDGLTPPPDPTVPATTPAPPERPPERLGQRAARGAAVTITAQVARIVVQTLSVVVLARLLDPRDYGLVAMVVAIVGVAEIFRDFGLSSAAIQAKSLSPAQRSNLFWINTGIGAALGIIVLACSELIALFYQHPELGAISRALSLTFLLNGISTQFRADLVRRLRFTSMAIADVASPTIGLAAAIVGAMLGWDYWALVAQQLAQPLSMTIIVIALTRWLPGLPSRHAEMRGMLRFGGNLVASQLVGYLSNNLDSIIIGQRFGAVPLGIYSRGFQLLMTPLSQMRSPSTTVALPVLSKLLDDPKRYLDFVSRGQLALGYTLVAGLGIVAAAAPQITEVFLGPKWVEVGPILRFLAIAGIFQTLAYVGYWVYLSRGMTSSLFRYTLVSASIKIACIVVGSYWGVLGVAIGYAIAPAIAWPISLTWLSRVTGLRLRPLVLGALRVLALTTWIAACATLALLAAAALPAIVQLLIALVAGLAGGAVLVLAIPLFRTDAARIVETVKLIPATRRAR